MNTVQNGFFFLLALLITIGNMVRLLFRSCIVFMWHGLNTIVLPVKRLRKMIVRRPSRPSLPIHIRVFPNVFPHIPIPHIHVLRFGKSIRLLAQVPKKPQFPNVPLPWIYQLQSFLAGFAVALIFIFFPYTVSQWLMALPNPRLLSRRDLEVTTKIFDRHGALLYEMYADQNRTPLPLTRIPQVMRSATIAIEDHDFYRHPGFSIKGIARAAGAILFQHQIQGGSTITQQLIKSALLSPQITLVRKVQEIILAFWAEHIYSKDQILEMYVNQVPYGGTAWGVEAASQTYFGKSVTQITLAEAALLAGLPAAPTEYSPFGSHPEKAIARQREVLRRMAETHVITSEEEKVAVNQPIRFTRQRSSIRAPHFVMYVKDLLEKKYGSRLVEQGGLQITTTLDINLQERIEDIVKSNLESLKTLHVGNGAALVTDPKTGEILAMVGSKNYFDVNGEGNVNVTTSFRQPGSTVKVITYASALENGFTAATILDDSPVAFANPGGSSYVPVNYDGKFHGAVPLRLALGNSYNIPAVKTLAAIGVDTMLQKARRMGIESWNDDRRFGLSLTLGGGEVTMLEMAKVFGTLANSGRSTDLVPIREITDYTGRIIERNESKKGIQAVTPEVAWILSDMLSDNNARMTAFGTNSNLVIPGKTVSVKTGTSNDKRDNWTIGYTPSYVTTVWVGNNDNSPMDPYLTSGITGAAPIWRDTMIELLKHTENEVIQKPQNVIRIPCFFGRMEYFVKGTQPTAGRCQPLPTPFISPKLQPVTP